MARGRSAWRCCMDRTTNPCLTLDGMGRGRRSHEPELQEVGGYGRWFRYWSCCRTLNYGICELPFSGSRPSEIRTSHVRGPREMSCPAFRAMRTPPPRKWAHRSHTSAVEIKIYWGFKRMLLIEQSQWPRLLTFRRYAASSRHNSSRLSCFRSSTKDPRPLLSRPPARARWLSIVCDRTPARGPESVKA